jgi:3-oxoacyl-[acyl-carrier protein] reductase
MIVDLHGKTAVVTGGNTGIGKSIAASLNESGATVVATYFSSSFLKTGESDREIIGLQLDATDSVQVNRVFSTAANILGGKIDILINNAGGLINRVVVEEMSDEHFHQVMDVNFSSAFYCTRAVLPYMAERGRIVNIGSLAAHNGGGAGAVIYAAGKAALVGFTRGLAKELAQRKTTVNLIAPGFIADTPFHEKFTPPKVMREVIDNTPLQRAGLPGDISSAVLFLVSEMGSFITGEILNINGGLYFN